MANSVIACPSCDGRNFWPVVNSQIDENKILNYWCEDCNFKCNAGENSTPNDMKAYTDLVNESRTM